VNVLSTRTTHDSHMYTLFSMWLDWRRRVFKTLGKRILVERWSRDNSAFRQASGARNTIGLPSHSCPVSPFRRRRYTWGILGQTSGILYH